jgi:uncharacterized protein YecE (DUF72 family)
MLQIGCQGWNYDDWITPASGRPIFYPPRTRPNDMLALYSQVFESVEVDSTFYAIPSASTIDLWLKRTPANFSFALKLPKEITHELSLHPSSLGILDMFCDRIRVLQGRLTAVLIQMPPQFELTPDNIHALREFLPHLPTDIRFCIEFRSRDWIRKSIIDQLMEYRVSLTLVEGEWISRESMWKAAVYQQADFIYVRWMGKRDLTRFDVVQRPQEENLKAWSEFLKELSNRIPRVYAYFSNYYEGHAPTSANSLKRLLSQPVVEASSLEDQLRLF